MMLSLRHGPPPAGRPMHPAQLGEVEQLAQQHGLQIVSVQHHRDAGNRPDITWDVLWLRLPDDGTGALPLLRHIVFKDQKSSTYKLALLRVLIRIADSTAGLVRQEDEDHVDLPLGLVALFWVRAFRQLVAEDLPQHPKGNKHLSFAKGAFHRLADCSPYDLRIGQHFAGVDAESLLAAIRAAVNCIRKMPATYITYPGSSDPVFPTQRKHSVRVRDNLRLDESFLWSFGTLSVPVHLWRAMSRYAPWIEPAILNEWVNVMRGYEQASTPWDKLHERVALVGTGPRHKFGPATGRRRAPGQLRAILRMDGATLEEHLRYRPLLPIRGMAMQRSVEPAAELPDYEPQQRRSASFTARP